MQSQPMHRSWEIDALASSKFLKSDNLSGRKTRSKPRGLLVISLERESGDLLHSSQPLFLRELVEVNGIEPMTSCLQSRRSPN